MMDPDKRKRLEEKGYIFSNTPQQWLGLTDEEMKEIERRIAAGNNTEKRNTMNSIADFTAAWQDTPEAHQRMLDAFTALYEADPALKAHREWVKANGDGCCGADQFHGIWKLLVQEMPADFRFLEIGVFRGQTTSLVGMLAEMRNKRATVVGVSPFDGRAMLWPFTGDVRPDGECSDYEKACDAWLKWASHWSGTEQTVRFVKGDSTDPGIRATVLADGPYDILYIDADHSYEYCSHDIHNYSDMVKTGGYIIMDDAGCSLKLPTSFFAGFEGSTRAVDEFLNPPKWANVGSLIHLRCFKSVR